MGRRIARITGTLCLIAGSILGTPTPAAAGITGELVFECTLKIDAYPSSSGHSICESGVIPAIANLTAGGTTTDGLPYFVDGLGSVQAAFTHSEACVAGGPPLLATLQGSLYVSGLTALHNGAPTTATFEAAVRATQVGTEIVVVVTSSRMSLGDGAVAHGGTAAGTGAYFPLLGRDNTCPEGGPMQALMQAEIDLPI